MPLPVAVLPFRETDYPAFAQLLRRADPAHASGEPELRHLDASLPPGFVLHRSLLWGDGLLGAVTVETAAMGDRWMIVRPVVAPDAPADTLARLWDEARRLAAPHAPRAFTTVVAGDAPERLAFFEGGGFRELERTWDSRLDLTSFEPERFAGAEERVRAAGLRLASVAQLPDDDATRRRLYGTVVELLGDVPFGERLNIWPYEVWLERYWRNPRRNPESTFVALAGEEIAGWSELRPGTEPDALTNGLTGVRRPWRGRGLARTLKVRALSWARDAGFRTVRTTNHSTNRPMLAINEALGFVREPARITLVRHERFEGPDDGPGETP